MREKALAAYEEEMKALKLAEEEATKQRAAEQARRQRAQEREAERLQARFCHRVHWLALSLY